VYLFSAGTHKTTDVACRDNVIRNPAKAVYRTVRYPVTGNSDEGRLRTACGRN
jgi:hypothetical protein